MKRVISLLLLFCLLLPLCGCQTREEYAAFYYRRVRFDYGTSEADGVLAPEQRNIEGHTGNLSYLAALYLAGPLEEKLCMVFPRDTQVLDIFLEGKTLFVTLSDVGASFSEVQFTLACAGFTLTFLELTGAETVTVTSGERRISLGYESFTLFDAVTESSFAEDQLLEVP